MINGVINKKYALLLALLSGVLLVISWPVMPTTFFIFVAFVPLLLLSNMPVGKWTYFGCIYIAMLLFNIGTTWWVCNASAVGGVGAFIINSLLMCLPWLLYKKVKATLSPGLGLIALAFFWLTFEYIHLQNWGLSWPWLTIGNVFAQQPTWVQWYSVTGVSGGGVWVWVINVLVYIAIAPATTQNFILKKKKRNAAIAAILLVIVPIIGSILTVPLVPQKQLGQRYANVAICQPNIDPYSKLTEGTTAAQINKLITISNLLVDSSTQLLLWPETALYSANRYNEAALLTNIELQPVFMFLKQYPKLQLLTGIESFKFVPIPTTYSNSTANGSVNYESYNGSVLLDSGGAKAFYHKTKLVPGPETMPWFLTFLDKWISDFGGTTNGYAPNETRTVIETNSGLKLAPSICYESIYGGFMRQYVANGANLITIITNDGWWGNTPGFKQHLAYAQLRAIENSVWVARSANTGTSAFITPYGSVLQPQSYNTANAISMQVPITIPSTFYSKFGNWLYKVCSLIAGLIFLFYLGKCVYRRN